MNVQWETTTTTKKKKQKKAKNYNGMKLKLTVASFEDYLMQYSSKIIFTSQR